MIAYPLGADEVPVARPSASAIVVTYLVPQTLLFIPMADIINPPARQHAVGGHADLPDAS